jgi:hypothetical protein
MDREEAVVMAKPVGCESRLTGLERRFGAAGEDRRGNR